ncbi:hypothetical protein Ndes2526B_g01675 [Nannochloris sp. 'desiccata']|nr:putative Protein furry homolog-like [Chlorella desiccata (nom. nud.)]
MYKPAQHSPSGSAGYTFAASVADALLYQFKEYARVALDNGDFVVDASYEKVLQGLQVAAPQAGIAVLDKLLTWRSDSLREVGSSRATTDSTVVLRRRLIVEALFLEAALRLVSGDPFSVPLPTIRELENLGFDWVLNGEKYVDGRTPDLVRLRDRVALGASQLLGKLSAVSLDSITDRFLKELALRIKAEANSPLRQELYTLCHGLRFLRLHGDNPRQLRSATNFLENIFPLKHVAPDKKSRLQQAIADMMTSVLAPLADDSNPETFGSGCDPALRKQWFATVALLRTELLRWTTKQAKQIGSGLPAVAVLTCLQEESALVASIDSFVELLHKQLKDKKNANMALLCLVRCVSCFLRRLRDRSDTERLTKWVARSVGPAVQGVAKGHLIAPEQVELMRQLCTVVAFTLPDYGIRGMILELLATDGSQPWESSMAGVKSLMSVLSAAPTYIAGKDPVLDLPSTAAALEAAVIGGESSGTSIGGGTASSSSSVGALAATANGAVGTTTTANVNWFPSLEACDQCLEMVKSGHHPLEAYNMQHLVAPVSAAVARLLGQCHQLHGYTRMTNSARPAPDSGPRDRLSALPVFVSLLQLTPYVVPDTWAAGGMADDLPGYTIHAEPSVRCAAVDTVRRCMVALPLMRDALVGGMATFIVRLQEEFTDVIKDSLRLLLTMLRDWDRLSVVDAATSLAAGEPAPSPSSLGIFNNISRVEGALLALLCSPDLEIRQIAVALLRVARGLHRSLMSRTAGGGGGGGGGGSDAGGTFGMLSTSRSSSGHYGQSQQQQHQRAPSVSLQLDPPPVLSLPHHVRRSTAGTGSGSGGGNVPAIASLPRHTRRSTFGSASALSPISTGTTPASGGSGGALDSANALSASVSGSVSAFHPSAASTPAHSAATHLSSSSNMESNQHSFYVADIIESSGDAFVKTFYWDFGTWSDTWREWRHVPLEASFAECLTCPRSADDSQGLRWARVLCEITREAWQRCERSAWWCHVEVATKLQSLIVIEPSGRRVLPQEGLRGELARLYSLIAAAAPLLDATHVGDRGLVSKEFVRLLVASARAGVDYAVLALGSMESSCHTLVAAEAAALADDYNGGTSGGGHGGGGGGGGINQSGSVSGARSLVGGGGGGGGRGSASRNRREEARLVHANVLRVLCSNLPTGSLSRNSSLRDRVIEFIVDTARYIALTVDVSTEIQRLRYCLCMIARQAALQLSEVAPQAFPPMLRKQLFDKFSLYCEDGQTPGLFRSELRRHIAVAKTHFKGKGSEQLRMVESEMMDSAEMLEHAALTAMAAMIAGPLFDADAGSPNGRVIAWLDRMLAPPRDTPAGLYPHLGGGGGAGNYSYAGGGFGGRPSSSSSGPITTWGPPKEFTARAALRNLLRSNTDLASVFIDRSYSPLPRVASVYFLVLAEVYMSNPSNSAAANTTAANVVPIEPHVAVTLVLHKVVDIMPSVRDAARGMLGTLSRRVWDQDGGIAGLPSSRRTTSAATPSGTATAGGGTGNDGSLEEEVVDGAVVVGSLSESHQAYQQHLSSQLARDHAELAHGIVMEVLSRFLTGGGGGGEVLLCLPPWLEYASFGRGWDGQWGNNVLRALCAVTAQTQGHHGVRRGLPVAQRLWETVASNRRNIIPTLDFLINQGMAESNNANPTTSSIYGAAGNSTNNAGAAAGLPGWGASGIQPSPACAVGKQAALYLSRVAPRQTIDHLAHEAAQQMIEPGERQYSSSDAGVVGGGGGEGRRGSTPPVSMGGGVGGGGTPVGPSRGIVSPSGAVEWIRIKEFHNKSSSAPLQQPLPQQQPLAVHAAAAVAAATASSSNHPLTPTSIAMAIKRTTLDLIVKTGAAVVDTVAVAGAAAVGISSGGLSTPGSMPRGTRSSIDQGNNFPSSKNTSGYTGTIRSGVGPMAAGAGYYQPTSGVLSGGDAGGVYSSSSLEQQGAPSRATPQQQQRPDTVDMSPGGITTTAATPEMLSPPPPRNFLTRPEVALCLLSEVACEKDEELRQHLPALLHIAILHADSTNPLVRQEACQLVQYLLYSLACKPLEGRNGRGGGGNNNSNGAGGGFSQAFGGLGGARNSNSAPSTDYARVAGVIGYLQSLGGEALWNWELPTLAQPWVPSAGYVAAFVQIVADCFYFDSSLRERWSAEALKWACCAASRHAASRSHQVFCALGPQLSSAACTALLAALQKCLQSASAQGLDTAVEILCTLRVLLANTSPQKLVVYPHVFAACVALLCSSVVRIGELAAALLIQLLDALDLSSAPVQTALISVLPLDAVLVNSGNDFIGNSSLKNVARKLSVDEESQQQQQNKSTNQRVLWPLGNGLLAGAPDIEDDLSAGGPWLALQQLLVKGLFQTETEALALEGMAAVARQIASAGVRRGGVGGGCGWQNRKTFGGGSKWGSNSVVGSLSPISAMQDTTNFMLSSGGTCNLIYSGGGGGLEIIIGNIEMGLAISLAASLPWLCVHVGAGELADSAAVFLADMAAAYAVLGWEQLAAVLAVLSRGPPPPAPPGADATLSWLPDLVEVICSVLFPTYARIVVQRLMETVQRAEERYQSAALSCLGAIFNTPGLDLGRESSVWFVQDSHLVELLSTEVGGPLGPKVLEVLQALAAFKDDGADSRVGSGSVNGGAGVLEWPYCMDDLGESNKVCAEALKRVVDACPGSAELVSGSKMYSGVESVGGEQLLPFLPGNVSAGGAGW